MGHRRTVEIAIAEADFEALFGEGEGEVGGDGGLSDAAFAGGDGDDFFDAGDGLFAGDSAGGVGCARRVFDADFDFGVFGTTDEWVEDGVAVFVDLLWDFGVAGLDLEKERGDSVFKREGLDESEGNDVPRKAGVFDGRKGGAKIVSGHGPSVTPECGRGNWILLIN